MKRPKPWYRASKSAWYVEHNHKQHRLGEHPEGAAPPKKTKAGWNAPKEILDAFYKLMATDPASLPKPEKILVETVCDLFLDHSEKHHSPDTFANYKHFLQSFCDAYGRQPAAGMKPIHVTRWLDAHPKWKGARRHAVIAVKRAFSWADQQGVLSPNPLRTLRADRVKRRTRVLTKDELAEILAAIRDKQFREFVQAMLETGCRPSEVARVTAADVNLDLGVWVPILPYEGHGGGVDVEVAAVADVDRDVPRRHLRDGDHVVRVVLLVREDADHLFVLGHGRTP